MRNWACQQLKHKFLDHLSGEPVRPQPHGNFAGSQIYRLDSLNEIVQLVGKDSLSANDQLTLETAKMVREDFLQQNSFVDIDSFSTYDRQEKLLAMILDYDKLCRTAITKGAPTARLFDIPARERIGRAKSVPAEEYVQVYADISASMEKEIDEVVRKAGEEL